MTRRTFLGSTAAAAMASAAPARLPIKKAIWFGMLPEKLSIMDRFKMARDAGFEEMEPNTETDPRKAEEFKKASDATKVRIHSVMNSAHWKYPLSSADPAVVAESMKGMETSLKNAQLWGADTVLLVPAVVNPQTSYKDAWTRSQVQIRKLIPMAEKMKVVIGIEEVWNKFLLSPLEMARYVDEFKSPWVRAYVDVGNMVFYGYPQDWIRTLNKRICKLHFKDFRFKNMKADFVNLREGDIDWKEVYKALAEVGYKGSATVELEGGDLPYLKDVSRRVDLILTGA
ncbi:MAG TPA: sugar phosphate isomerase/epimerase family protein [Bryobacteraceae bacterium]|jgi:L-ribulose-5-phosphate 3-epimerase|nr:sugar phosphate isomerase/epimerase family protein [Bryobacteraceae bacterium]